MQGRLENLIGALALTIGDELRDRTENVAGCGPSSAAALLSLLRRPEQSIESLRRSVGLSHSATVRLVDRLADEGLATRRPAFDGRAVSLVLTAKGRRRVVRLHQERRAVLARSVVGLSGAQRRSLEDIAATMLRNLGLRLEDPTPICQLCELATCPLRRCPVPSAR